jgi:hypothetical protein
MISYDNNQYDALILYKMCQNLEDKHSSVNLVNFPNDQYVSMLQNHAWVKDQCTLE